MNKLDKISYLLFSLKQNIWNYLKYSLAILFSLVTWLPWQQPFLATLVKSLKTFLFGTFFMVEISTKLNINFIQQKKLV